MIRDILYLIVYFITETVLYSLAYRTVLSRGITNKAVKWMVYIIAVVITGSIVYVNNNLQYVMGASIFIMVMLPVFIIEPFKIQNLILYPFVVIASSIFGMLFSFIISIKIGIEQNRCAMACQGCDAVFLFLNKKQWKPSPNSSIVKSPQPTIKQDRHYHCL